MKLFPLSISVAAVALLCSSNVVTAQAPKPCGTDEIRAQMIEENPDLLRLEAEYELGLQEYLQMKAGLRDDDDTAVYVLPVVFHILYDPTANSDAHNITDAQIYQAMNVMNRDYAKENADISDVCCGFQAIAADTRIQFQLATKDPYGNCTNGIDRITTQRSTQGGNFSKLNSWFRDRYINIWVVRSLGSSDSFAPAGFSQLPPDVQDDNGGLRDGVILLYDYTGDNGTSNVFRSRTLTHEIGHYLNLKHVWGGTNAPGIACGDDGVDDTPMTKGHNSCTDVDLYDSFCSWQPVDTFYTFQDVTLTSGTTDPTPTPAAMLDFPEEVALSFSPGTAIGVSANSAEEGSFSFSQWGTGAQEGDSAFSDLTGQLSTSQYYSFTVTPELGKSMTLSGLTFEVDRSATGPRTFAVRSSVNNYSANIPAVVSGADTVGLSVPSANTFFFRVDTSGTRYIATVNTPQASYLNLVNPVTFRIYAWNAEDVDGSFTVDSLAVRGQFGIIENTQNYMEYAYCSRMFTNGQSDRMRATLNSSVSGRSTLWSEGNHIFTGTAGHEVTCGPKADFYTIDRFVCTGVPVQFKDNSTNATPTTWAWTFEGGNPATSDQQNPTVTFSEHGPRSVTLTVGNDHGSSTITKWDAVVIGANYPEVNGLLQESFDNLNNFNFWPKVNYENNGTSWRWDDQVGHDAPGSAKLNASDTYTLVQDMFAPNNFQDKDVLLTPILEMPFYTGLTMSFWYAYSTRTGTADDITESLKVYASTDCGKSWLLRHTLDGPELVTAGVRSPGYMPEADEWRKASFTLPSLFAGHHVRIKFEYASGLYSNDLYIDDVNIDATNVGVEEFAQHGGISLMPNPASNSLTVVMDLAGATTGTLSFLDMTGRTVYTQAVNAGESRLDLNLDHMGLTSGVYLVRLKHANGQRTERLVVR
ncbi:MAG: M43 family zinc metalloprotease [Flavobacteriales bacterium]|nr:T9SS type A sorting domain-containing protein [Flavobacteriales bacterium]